MSGTTKRKDSREMNEGASQPRAIKKAGETTPRQAAEGRDVRPAQAGGKRFRIVQSSAELVDSYADGALGMLVRSAILNLDPLTGRGSIAAP